MRLFPLFRAILRDALDADGKKIVNLATPTQDADAANKRYVDENGGGAEVLGKLPMRPLPKYLHCLSFDDTYPADAAWLYAQLGPSDTGRCSAVRRGGKLWRNYDWTFDDAAEFVVKVSCSSSRFGSVGVASVGSRLTENDVMSAVNSRYYKCLPGMTLDGINEKCVVCEINVDGGPKTGWHGDADDGGIHILAAVRWVLDHGETAAQAAEWIADHIIQPQGEMNFHFMVADATSTYIVENGAANDVTDGTKVLTNYAIYDEAHEGGGKERYTLLAGGADISAVNFTNAYQSGNTWDSDFESAAQHAEAIEQWAAQGTDKEAHRGKTTSSGKAWWQSVHTTEYDFAAKTMKVAVQEVDDWYTFAVDQANVDLTPIEAQIAALQDGKRNKTDGDFGESAISVGSGGAKLTLHADRYAWNFGNGDVSISGELTTGTHVRIGNAAYGAPSGRLSVNGSSASIKKDGKEVATEEQVDAKRPLTDNTCHKTEFTEWTLSGADYDPSQHNYNVEFISDYEFGLYIDGGQYPSYYAYSDHPDTVSELEFIGVDITATRSAVCTKDKLFVTDDVVDGKMSSAVSTNNPAFVSAVRNTPTSGMPEDMPTDWGTYGTVGAALAALAAGLKWCKNILGTLASGYSTFAAWIASKQDAFTIVQIPLPHYDIAVREAVQAYQDGEGNYIPYTYAKTSSIFGTDGKPTDDFATDLLGKQVANAKVRYALATTSSATMADRTVNLYTLSSGTVPMVFPTATTHDGKTYARDFLLKLTYSGGTLQMPTGVTKVGDELSFEAGKTYLIAFTEIAADKFYVRAIDITEAQA